MPEAEADLAAIGDWIAQDDPDAAYRWIAELRGKAQAIGTMPLAFPKIELAAADDCRKRTHGRYVIIYRGRDTVEVLRIVHAARNYPTLFEKP